MSDRIAGPANKPEAKRPRVKDLGKHGLWIFGAVVGLAIREAITTLFSHVSAVAAKAKVAAFIAAVASAPYVPQTDRYHELLEAFRFIVFFFTISRFYIGAAQFFESVHGEASTYDPKKTWFAWDFMFGLVHFVLFFGWALSLNSHDAMTFGFTAPLLWMFGILAYDFVWFVMSANHSTRNVIAQWTALNLLTGFSAFFVFAITRGAYHLANGDPDTASVSAELLATFTVLAFGAYDFRALLWGETALPSWMQHVSRMFQKEVPVVPPSPEICTLCKTSIEGGILWHRHFANLVRVHNGESMMVALASQAKQADSDEPYHPNCFEKATQEAAQSARP